MYTIDDLTSKLLTELRGLADQFGISDGTKFLKKDLVYKILDQQSRQPGEASPGTQPSDETTDAAPTRIARSRKTQAEPDATLPASAETAPVFAPAEEAPAEALPKTRQPRAKRSVEIAETMSVETLPPDRKSVV